MGRLQDRVAFITGGARGMGRLIALKFAGEGAQVVTTDIAGSLRSVPYSLSSGSQLDRTVAEVEEKLDGIQATLRQGEYVIDGQRIELSFSYGLASFPEESAILSELVRIADDKMYVSKKAYKEKHGLKHR